MELRLRRWVVITSIIVLVIGGLAVGAVTGFTVGQSQQFSDGGRHQCSEVVLRQMPGALNLNLLQRERLQRVMDRAVPELNTIRQDARQKRRAVTDAALSEIIPLLTPDQQKKLDELEKAREELRNAKRKLETTANSSTPPF